MLRPEPCRTPAAAVRLRAAARPRTVPVMVPDRFP
jgi:hypothetical protein